MARSFGFEEARRGAYNPTYLYYTLGKLEIYKLRADYQKAKGSAYSSSTMQYPRSPATARGTLFFTRLASADSI